MDPGSNERLQLELNWRKVVVSNVIGNSSIYSRGDVTDIAKKPLSRTLCLCLFAVLQGWGGEQGSNV